MGDTLHMVNIDIKLIPSILCPFKLQGIVDKFTDTAYMYMKSGIIFLRVFMLIYNADWLVW